MGIKRRYKNMVEKFLSKDKGRRFFQFFYNWGAAIVIIGALAKLEHWPYGLGTILLTLGLLTEFFVFFISAFDTPAKEYEWGRVFPVLDTNDADDRPQFGNGNGNGGAVIAGVEGDEGTGIVTGSGGPIIIGGGVFGGGMAAEGGETPSPGAVKKSFGIPNNVDITEEDTNALTASIKKMAGAADQLSKMAELADVTQQYLDKLTAMSENMDRFSNVTNDLSNVSDTLLTSYKSIVDDPDAITENSKSYVHQMDSLNQNVAKLNNIYEIQIQSINSQMEAISRINAGLLRMKDMYEGSVMDSTVFKSETEKMTHHIASLNAVYARLLNAMTMNANMQGVYTPPNPGYNPNPGGYAPNPGAYTNPPYNNPNPGYNPGTYNNPNV